MNESLLVHSERVDDIPLIIGLLIKIGLVEVVDEHIKRHWLHEGLSSGWLTVVWLGYVLTEGDHTKLHVQDWVKDHRLMLERLIGQPIRDTDFTDDRLGILLGHLGKVATWEAIEQDLWLATVRVYQMPVERVRVDSTTVPGYHEITEDGLMQLGHSKDHRPDLPQEKVMAASVDPAAHLVATEVISGQKADDPLYVPIIKRVILLLNATGLLFVGDCKMAALSTRTFLVHREQHYLMPLPETGKDGQEMAAWIEAIVAGEQNATLIYQRIEEGSVGAAEVPDQAGRLVAAGYEFTRQQQGEIDGKVVRWTERVLVVRSLDHARSSQQGLEKRLRAASEALWALTPAPGRGKRQFHDETALQEAAEAILKARRLSGLLTYSYQQEVKQEIRYIGRGRHGPGRAQHIIEHVRYVITGVERQETTITETKNRLGWQAYVTDVRVAKLPFAEAVCVYRGEWRIEGNFQRFKGKPVGIAPIFVHKDDQIRGLTHFLSLAVRFCTLTEYVVRRGLAQQEMTLPGLYEGNSRRETARPTTQRLLKAFDNITLTRIEITGMPVIWHITPLSALQQQILSLLGLQAALYADLVVNST